VFLAGCAALSAAWLWLRPAPPTPHFGPPPSPTAGAARPAAIPAGIHVDAAILERYTGRYSADGLAVKISVDGERLVVQAEDLPTYGLRALTEIKFFFEDFPGEITFDDGEPAPGFVADLADGRHRGTRVRD
jgi:hypothetical protein